MHAFRSVLAQVLFVGAFLSSRADGQRPSQAQGYTFTRLDVPGATHTGANGISDVGTIVGAYTDPQGNRRGYTYDGGVFNLLTIPGAPDALPSGINSAGTFVGTYTDASGSTGAFIDQAGVFAPYVRAGLGSLDPLDINDRGDIIGSAGGREGFVDFWGTNFYVYSLPGTVKLFPRGVAPDELTVGYFQGQDNFSHGFITDGVVPFFRYFDVPGATDTFAEDFNSSFGRGTGQIVGSYWESIGGTKVIHGFVWDDASLPYPGDTFYTLDVPGAYRTEATGINDVGQIVGTYYDESGQHAFIASTTTPEPGTLALLGTGLLSIAVRRRNATKSPATASGGRISPPAS